MHRRHAKTLEAIFRRPTSGTIRWIEIEALLLELGARIQEREGARVASVLFGEVQIFHRPRPTPNDKSAVASIRRWLQSHGVKAVMNTLTIDGLKALISFDEDSGQFRGEFLGLNGGADFYASSVDGLKEEGRASLLAFLSVCAENDIEPYRSFSGKFLVRIPENLHADAAHAASTRGVSLNDLVRDAIMHEIAVSS